LSSRKYETVEASDIDEHELALDLVQHPASALEVQADLVDACLHGHVHRGERRRAHVAIGAKTVAGSGNAGRRLRRPRRRSAADRRRPLRPSPQWLRSTTPQSKTKMQHSRRTPPDRR
jgi:hypothetical protein